MNGGSRGAVYYFCFDDPRPTGGNKTLYRHVELLSAAGQPAFIVHRRARFRLRWFESQARVVSQAHFERAFEPARDVCVLPEDYAIKPMGRELLERSGPKVIFNQNVFRGFVGPGSQAEDSVYEHPNVCGAFTVSAHNESLLRLGFPELRTMRVAYGVDTRRFRFVPLARKRRWIACAVKSPELLFTLHQLLQARARRGMNVLGGWKWFLLSGLNETETAAVLAQSALFIFLSTLEGLPILPLEAQLSGCAVAAFDQPPIDESVARGYRVPSGDVEALVAHVEGLAKAAERKQAWLVRRTQRAAAKAARFSLAREQTSVLRAWSKIWGRLQRGTARGRLA